MEQRAFQPVLCRCWRTALSEFSPSPVWPRSAVDTLVAPPLGSGSASPPSRARTLSHAASPTVERLGEVENNIINIYKAKPPLSPPLSSPLLPSPPPFSPALASSPLPSSPLPSSPLEKVAGERGGQEAAHRGRIEDACCSPTDACCAEPQRCAYSSSDASDATVCNTGAQWMPPQCPSAAGDVTVLNEPSAGSSMRTLPATATYAVRPLRLLTTSIRGLYRHISTGSPMSMPVTDDTTLLGTSQPASTDMGASGQPGRALGGPPTSGTMPGSDRSRSDNRNVLASILPAHDVGRALAPHQQCQAWEHGDDAHGNLIIRVGDVFENPRSRWRYIVIDSLGSGSFGCVVKCALQARCGAEFYDAVVAVKIVRNHPAYSSQATLEVQILSALARQKIGDSGIQIGRENIVSLVDHFFHRGHVCIVFEYLPLTLLDVLSRRGYKGLAAHHTGLGPFEGIQPMRRSFDEIREILRQILQGVHFLHASGLIHADIKPENIMIGTARASGCSRSDSVSMPVRLIDFGSAGYEGNMSFPYIQSRFYRAPEAILGCLYDSSIDMWSIGCVAMELFTGLPLFPGCSELDMLVRMLQFLGLPPQWMLESGSKAGKYFVANPHANAESSLPHFRMPISEHMSPQITRPEPMTPPARRVRRAHSDADVFVSHCSEPSEHIALPPAPAPHASMSGLNVLPSMSFALVCAALEIEARAVVPPTTQLYVPQWNALLPCKLRTAEEFAALEGKPAPKGRQYYPAFSIAQAVLMTDKETGLLKLLQEDVPSIREDIISSVAASGASVGPRSLWSMSEQVSGILLEESIGYARKRNLDESEIQERLAFADFVQRLVCYDPRARMTPAQALVHPFMLAISGTSAISPLPSHSEVSLQGLQARVPAVTADKNAFAAISVAHALVASGLGVEQLSELSRCDHGVRAARELTFNANVRRLRGFSAAQAMYGAGSPFTSPAPEPIIPSYASLLPMQEKMDFMEKRVEHRQHPQYGRSRGFSDFGEHLWGYPSTAQTPYGDFAVPQLSPSHHSQTFSHTPPLPSPGSRGAGRRGSNSAAHVSSPLSSPVGTDALPSAAGARRMPRQSPPMLALMGQKLKSRSHSHLPMQIVHEHVPTDGHAPVATALAQALLTPPEPFSQFPESPQQSSLQRARSFSYTATAPMFDVAPSAQVLSRRHSFRTRVPPSPHTQPGHPISYGVGRRPSADLQSFERHRTTSTGSSISVATSIAQTVYGTPPESPRGGVTQSPQLRSPRNSGRFGVDATALLDFRDYPPQTTHHTPSRMRHSFQSLNTTYGPPKRASLDTQLVRSLRVSRYSFDAYGEGGAAPDGPHAPLASGESEEYEHE